MINFLSGKIIEKNENSIVLENNGIGFEIFVAKIDKFILEQNINLSIYMHFNQEKGFILYGFLEKLEKTIFKLIINCSGIGPKLALNILEQIEIKCFLTAISNNDIKFLSSLTGVGNKKAEQLILELKNKIKKLDLAENYIIENDKLILDELQSVLNSLNYSSKEISAIKNHLITNNLLKNIKLDEAIRIALNFLSKNI